MKFSVITNGANKMLTRIAERMTSAFLAHGHEITSAGNGTQCVFNLTDMEAPRPFRRSSRTVFVASLVDGTKTNGNIRSACYAALVRSLSNLLICVVPRNGFSTDDVDGVEVYCTTPEAGFYHLPFEPEELYKRIIPLAGAHFAVDNRFSTDLPDRFWETSPVIEKIKHYGRELDNLGVLPAPFPLRDLLTEEDIKHVYKIYGITGLSYGNLSAREHIPELGDCTFWMTGRGVNKANLNVVGKDVLLLKGFDREAEAALVSVPPAYCVKARASVDAVEHELIYRTFPAVGAIVHVHAWMAGVPCTAQNHACGTRELAEEVVGLLRQTEEPSRTAVGLKNHGLTITGIDLDEIFARIGGRLQTEVPMFA